MLPYVTAHEPGLSVKTTLHARHLELDERLKAQVERKFRRLDRVTDANARATVELTPRSRVADAAYVAEITLVMSGATLRRRPPGQRRWWRSTASSTSSSGRSSAPASGVGNLAALPRGCLRPAPRTAVEPERAGEVVEISRLDMIPMFPEDAIARMEEEVAWRSSCFSTLPAGG